MRAQAAPITALEGARIDDPALDLPAAGEHLWQIIEDLRIVPGNALIAPGTEALHHVLPDLMPQMDRAWTGAFFPWPVTTPRSAQAGTLTRALTGLGRVARSTRPAGFIGQGWHTSRTKVLDNAITRSRPATADRPALSSRCRRSARPAAAGRRRPRP